MRVGKVCKNINAETRPITMAEFDRIIELQGGEEQLFELPAADDLRIGIFAYNFEHKKTQEGLLNLFLAGYRPSFIVAQNKIELKHSESIRVDLKDLKYDHPEHIAQRFNIPYYVTVHNSDETIKIIKEYQADIGIVLGARILSKDVIDSFKIGIINMHPALLPENRGADNIIWAIWDEIPQGVTVHLIDKKVDAGWIVYKEIINVYRDDTLLDIRLRLQNKELELMIKTLDAIAENNYKKIPSEGGVVHKQFPLKQEHELMVKFEKYKENYESINKYNMEQFSVVECQNNIQEEKYVRA